MGFIEFLVIGVLIYYVARMLIRMLLPMLFQSLVNKAQQQQGGRSSNYQRTNQPDGRVKVDYAPKTKSQIPDSEGDFIDYEEIK